MDFAARNSFLLFHVCGSRYSEYSLFTKQATFNKIFDLDLHAVWNILQSSHSSCANEIAPLLHCRVFQNSVKCLHSQETSVEGTNIPGWFPSHINICGFQIFTQYMWKRYISTPTGILILDMPVN